MCHMVASEHPEVIDWRIRLIATDVIDSEEAADNDGADLDEDDDISLGKADVKRCSRL